MATISNAQSVQVNNRIIKFVPNSVQIKDNESTYTVNAQQSGREITTENYINGSKTETIIFGVLNTEYGRDILRYIRDELNGIVTIIVNSPDTSYTISNGAFTGSVTLNFANEGTIEGFEITGKVVTANKL